MWKWEPHAAIHFFENGLIEGVTKGLGNSAALLANMNNMQNTWQSIEICRIGFYSMLARHLLTSEHQIADI